MHTLPFILAHASHPHESGGPPSPWTDWPFEPVILASLVLTLAWYALGVHRLWRRAGYNHGLRLRHLLWFALAFLSLLIALVSPLHPLGSRLFSAHMTQHEILMLLSAPLLVMSHPLVAFLHALPRSAARSFGRVLLPFQFLTLPLPAFLFHGIVLWLWHVPILFQWTLTNDFVHFLQHASFLGSAIVFWYALLRPAGQPTVAAGVGVIYLFLTALHSGLLGALLTFARSLWYPAYTDTAPQLGLSPLEDQQIGGLIMWIPPSLLYIFAALVLLAHLLRSNPDAHATALIARPAAAPDLGL